MRRQLVAAAAAAALMGCLPFEDDGLYACDTENGEDCVTCDGATGWCRDITAIAEGASTLYSISGAGSNAIWASGSNGVVLHWNGSRWAPQSSGTSASIYSIWAASPTDVFAVGESWTWLHYGGSGWTSREELTTWSWPPDQATEDVTVLSFTAVGGFSNGSTGIAWALDQQGMVNFLCDGASCDGSWPESAPQDGSYWALYGVIQDGMVPAAVTEPGVSPSNWVNLWGVWADAQRNSYFVGRHGAIVRDTVGNVDWSTVDVISMPDPAKADLFAILGDVNTGNFMAVGETGAVFFYDRASGSSLWTQATVAAGPITADLYGICATAANDIFVVGTQGVVLYFDGLVWSTVPQPYQETLLNCYTTAGDLFAVSDEGAILRLRR